MIVSEEEYQRIALAEPDKKWELDRGRLRSKPPMTTWHNRTAWLLGVELQNQLGSERYEVRVDAGRTRRSPSHYFIPDVMVMPLAAVRRGLMETLYRGGIVRPVALPGVAIDLDALFAVPGGEAG